MTSIPGWQSLRGTRLGPALWAMGRCRKPCLAAKINDPSRSSRSDSPAWLWSQAVLVALILSRVCGTVAGMPTMRSTLAATAVVAVLGVTATACAGSTSTGTAVLEAHGDVSSASAHHLEAASSPKPGRIYVFTNVDSHGKGSVLITGVIGDLGKQFPANKNGKPDSNADYEEVVLRHGTLLLDERALTNGHWTYDTNVADCSSTVISQHPVPVLDGTGKYVGISGTLSGVATEAILSPRYKSGKLKGQCSQTTKVGPARHIGTMNGSGSVTF
jgi:hypothetical protein